MSVIEDVKAAGAIAAQKLGLSAPVDPFVALLRGVVAESGAKLATDAEISELRRLQTKYAKVASARDSFLPTRAEAAHAQHLAELGAAIVEGRHDHGEAWSVEDFKDDFRERYRAAELQLRRLTGEAMPVATAVVERFVKATETIIRKLEKGESTTYGKFGLPYEESSLLRRLRLVPEQVRRLVPTDARFAGPPARMLPFLDLN